MDPTRAIQHSTRGSLRSSTVSPVSRDEGSFARRSVVDVSPVMRPQWSDHEFEEFGIRDNILESARNTAGEDRNDVIPPLIPPSKHSSRSSSSKPEFVKWLPTSLTRVYLLSLAVLSFALGICCFTLVAYSYKHNGLSNASSNAGFKFNKKFLPTLVAVLYTLLWTPVVVDVIRTEPWALLSLPLGSRARDSLLKRDRLWWSYLAEAARSKKRTGGIRWALFISVIASLVASIVVNPLSAGLFDTLSLLVTEERQFSGIVPPTSDPQPQRISDVTYLRAVTNILFNVSTSAWNTDEYTVAPFWPSDLDGAPMDASLARSPQLWKGDGEVVVAQVQCRPFTAVSNSTEPYGGTVWTGLPYLQTDDGCAVIPPKSNQWCNGGIWGQISNTSSQVTFEKCTAQGYRDYFLFCSRNASSTGLLHQGFNAEDKTYFSGQVCNTSYLTANIPVDVSTSSSGSSVSFDQALFIKAQRPMENSYLSISDFESEFIRQTGSNHLRPTLGIGFGLQNSNENSNFEGPALVLAASNNYSIDALIQMDPTKLAQQAAIIKQRFLGEVLLSSFDDLAQANQSKDFQASVTKQQFRLVADLGIGITLGLIFILLAGIAASLAFLVALSKRPLQLLGDPNKSSTAALSLHGSKTSACFNNLDRALPGEIETILKDQSFLMRNGKLISIDDSTTSALPTETSTGTKPKHSRTNARKTLPKNSNPDWRPFTLRRRSGSLLVIFLLSVTAALAAVYAVSRKRPLYQSAFVYQSDVKIGNLGITTLAPYSIIPTLVAVGIKLWWVTLDVVYRRLAPFLAMARSPTPKVSEGASISYITTPILWITLLSLRRGYWLLALVTFGTLTAEILQISMSALWSREPGVLEMDLDLTSQFELRSVAHVFEDSQPRYRTGTNIVYPKIAEHLYGGELYQTSWVYGSLAELAFGSFPPAWSRDGWNFPPVNVSGVSKSLPKLPTTDDMVSSKSGSTPSSNVTFDSMGLRGRVECVPIDDGSRWVLEVTNFTNMVPYNSSRNATKPNLTHGFEFSPDVRVVNFTKFDGSQPGTVAIGQWLHFNYSSSRDRGDPLYNPANSQNFTVIWTNACYPYRYEGNTTAPSNVFDPPPRLIFTERPQVQALNCRPIFETSKARIVVNNENGRIEDYTLLEPAKPVPDAWNDSFTRHFSNETAYYDSLYDLDDVRTYNTTVSWGYLFQLALLQACNVQGFITGQGDNLGTGIPGPTPFSFIESDLYSDPYSYASLALVNYNRTALLNATTLTAVTQRVFSTFFQWFASSQSGYTGNYWAYQAFNSRLPPDLDFGPVESSLTTTETLSRAETMCESRMSTYETLYTEEGVTTMRTFSVERCARPTSTSYTYWTRTDTYVTIVNTRTTARSSPLRTSSQRATTTPQATTGPTATAVARFHKRVTPTTPANDPRVVHAKVSVHTETLVISSAALFLSISIILLLIVSAFVIYLVQGSQLRVLPRDFDSPASLLAAVYASEKLKSWGKREQEKEKMVENGSRWGERRAALVDDDIAVRMGYFTGVDGEEHWGIEVSEDYPLLLEKPAPQDG